MQQKLEVVISSSVEDGVRGLTQMDKATDKLSKDTQKASESISRSYNQIGAASKALSSNNQQLSKTVVNASGTLTSFSRIVQDAPFGIIGVGNNITQFAEQFSYLKTQTGSAGSALKSLGQSLLGTGGITLGISLLVTGVTALVQKYGSLGNAIDAVLHPLNEQQRIQKLVTDAISQGQIEGQKEVVQLDKLYKATQNVNVPLSERNKIVDDLQKQYPSYFGNLSNEAILAGNAASQYNRLREALIGAATVRGIDKQLEEQGGKLGGLLVEQADIRTKLAAAVEKERTARERLSKFLDDGVRTKAAVDQQDRLTKAVSDASQAVSGYVSDLRGNATAQGEVIEAQKQLSDIQQQLIAQFGSVAAGISQTGGAAKKAARDFKELKLDGIFGRQDIFIKFYRFV